MSIFNESQSLLEQGVKTLDPVTKEAPQERVSTPHAARAIYSRFALDDADSSFNRALVQGYKDFNPPHDAGELENKGQADRFNITTGEGVAILNEAVSAYMDIFTTPKIIASIPFKKDVKGDKETLDRWSYTVSEKVTELIRSDEDALTTHLTLSDIFVTHGVSIGYFDDGKNFRYSATGLEDFKFPRKSGLTSSGIEIGASRGFMSVTELWSKIKDGNGTDDGWDELAVKTAILDGASRTNIRDWKNWEGIERDLKSNEMYVSTICNPIELILLWVKEFNGKVSFYITTMNPSGDGKKSDISNENETFLFKERDVFSSANEAYQIFTFTVGNKGRLYTVRGLGYLIYQICNSMDIMHCKMLDNAMIAGSLLVQPTTAEDAEDLQLIDFGGGVAIPPTMKILERNAAPDLNRSIIPAIDASRRLLDRTTGGSASANQILNSDSTRQTKVEFSTKLDVLDKLNSFAINLFFGPYSKLRKEQIRRIFQETQPTSYWRNRISEMKKAIVDAGVPEDILKFLDFDNIKVTRIIGNGSRASRLMLYDEASKRYSTFDAPGRKHFDYDSMAELMGPEYADKYVGHPTEERQPIDKQIALLENYALEHGEYFDPGNNEDKMTHLDVHLTELEVNMDGIENGTVDLADWTMHHTQLYKHAVETMQGTTVHPVMQAQLNAYRKRLQQVGEIVMNGLRHLNREARRAQDEQQRQNLQNLQPNPDQDQAPQGAMGSPEQLAGAMTPPPQGPVNLPQGQPQDPKIQYANAKLAADKQKWALDMQMAWQQGLNKLQMDKLVGQQKMTLAAQKAMMEHASKDSEQSRAERQHYQDL